ncbi:hypothetical protein ABT143_09230 [Streptomyces sp. NPDC002033]|uniref:hypothetical protein n=1 Tax=unclassified Streptomyces TaxID=2593676 RepID=UPI003323F248
MNGTLSLSGRAASAAAAAVVLAGVVTAAGPASAAPSAAAPSAAACTPRLQVLGAIGSSVYNPGGPQADGVIGLGKGNLSVGVSGGLPVYWTGTTVHKVPLTAPAASGEVLAVNKDALMVGRAFTTGGGGYLFTYRAGAAAVTPLPGGDELYGEADVNDAGYVVSRNRAGVGLVWKDGQKVRELAPPADAPPHSFVDLVTGINNKGDIAGTAKVNYYDSDHDQQLWESIPVVWPADGGPAKSLAPSGGGIYQESRVQDIDESGRVVGYDWYGPGYAYKPWTWTAPYTAPGTSPGTPAPFPYGTFEAISPTTNISVGTAKFHPDEPTRADQAQLWKGTGPVLALPRLAADKASTATAVSDDGRVGGAAVNANGKLKPVIWTCAAQQAYLSQS